jgi:hypothetical protein
MFEDLTKEEIEQLLADYIATAENPKYGGDMDIVNSKFPEFKDVDKQLLADYIATAQNPEYGGDMDIVNSKFPEFFSEPKKKDVSESESGTSDGSSYEPLSTEELEGLIPGTQQVQRDAVSTEIGMQGEAEIQRAKDEEAALIRAKSEEEKSAIARERALKEEEERKAFALGDEGFGKDTEQKFFGYDRTTEDISPGIEAMSTPKEGLDVVKMAEEDARIRQETQRIAEQERIELEKEQQKLLEETKQFVQSEAFQQELESIDLEAETAVSDLHKTYNKYGFTFTITPQKMGDTYGIVARSSNGETISVRKDDDQTLKDFISANAEISKEVKDEDFLTKAFNVKKSRRVAMKNEDGSESTVVMASADNFAFPTIFPKDPNSKSKNPADWHVFDISTRDGVEKAIAMAKKRGEIYQFKTNEEANEFAEGAWKESSIEDIEGDKFFKERDLDYRRVMSADRRYQEVHDEIEFIKKQLGLSKQAEWDPAKRKWEATYKPSEEFIKDNPEIYLPSGEVRSDVYERINELEQEKEKLRQVVVGDKKNQEAIEEFNRYLQAKSEKLAVLAAKQNSEVKEEISILDKNMNKVLEQNGIDKPIEEITSDELAEAIKKNPKLYDELEKYNLIRAGINGKQKLAADNYYLGTTYFNRKTRKYIETEFVDNWSSVTSQWEAGKARGNAAAMLMGMSLGIEDLEDLDVKKLSEHLSKQKGIQGRAFSRYMNARDATDKYGHALLSDPVEIIGSLMANSLGMLLPIGTEVVSDPKLFAATFGTGAAASAYMASGTGNPLAVGGAGLVGGLSTLQASVSFAMELENSILEAAEEAGFDMSDPVQAEQALASKEVWEKGRDIGVKRGLSIGLVELLTAGMGGKVFKVAKTASTTKKTAAFLGERLVYDPISEGAGEAAALVVSGQGFDLGQVIDESLGGLGSNATTGSVALYMQTNKKVKIATALELTDRDAVAKNSASFDEVSKFATNMHRLGQIDESVNNAIQENLSLREEARGLLGLSKKEKSNDVVSRTMDLLKAQKTLSKDDNSKKIYKDELQKIDQELSYMVKEGKLAPDDMTTDISNVKDETGEVVSMDPKVKTYKINGRNYTKADFKRKYDKMSEKKRKKATFEIKNDPDFNAEIKQESGVMPTATTATPTTTATTVDAAVDADVTAIAEQSFESIDAVPADIREAATVIQEKEDGTFQVNDENYATIDAVPQEVMASDAVITQKQDGSVDVKYNEDMFTVEAAPITDTFESMDQIPQNIKDAASTQIVENDKGEFEVTYKEAEVLAQQMGKKKPSTPQFMMGDDKKPKKVNPKVEKLKQEGVYDGIIDFLKSDQLELSKQLLEGQDTTVEEFISSEGVIDDILKDSKGKTREQALNGLIDALGGTYEAEKLVMKAHAKTFNRIDPKTGEPLAVITPSGDAFVRLSNGFYKSIGTEPPFSLDEVYDSFDALLGEEWQEASYVSELSPSLQSKIESGEVSTPLSISDDAQFQLDTEVDTKGRKEELTAQAKRQMEEMTPGKSNEVDVAEKGKTIPIEVKENTKLANKLKKVGLDFLVGKKINLVMADQLKVDKKRMGGPFFPLIDKLFGKIAWASMDKKAAGSIITGAMKSDYSVVYNMNPDAIDSNSIMGETLLELLSELSPSEQKVIFSQMKENVLSSKSKDFEKIQNVFKKSKNLKEAFDKLQKLSVDDRAALIKKVIPSRDVEAGTEIGKSLQKNGITIEKLREINSEQFVADLPAGALTMILEVKDKNGNKVKDLYDDINSKYDNKEINPKTGKRYTKKDVNDEIERIKQEATVMPEQQKKEGLPSHPNYDVYVRGEAVALLNETTPFWNVIKEAAKKIEKGIVGIIKARTGNAKEGLSNIETSIFEKLSEAKKDKYSTAEKKKVIESILKKEAKKITLKDSDGKSVKAGVIKDLKEAFKQTSKEKVKNAINVALTPFAETRDKTAKESRSNEMRSAMMSASDPKDISVPAKTRYQMFVEKLSSALPGVQVVTSQKEFDALLRDLNAKALATKSQKIYGAVYDGKLYLNPSLENFNTPIHEFGHIWTNTVKELRPDLYEKGMSLIEESDYVSEVENNKDYKRVTDQMKKEGASDADIKRYILEEALATAIGDKGESFATAAQQRNFKGWLTDLFNFVKKLTGISKLSSEQVQNLTLDQFLQGVVVDLLSENELFKKAEVKNLSNQLQMQTSDGSNMSLSDIITQARQEGYSDGSIKEYLKTQGYKVAEINKAMAIQLDINTQMPEAFTNVFGGAKAGIEMFNDIKNKLDNWVKSRWGKGKSFTEYRMKAMELLSEHDLYKAQKSIDQQKLMSGMDTVIGRKKAKDVNAPIKAIRDTLKTIKNNNWKGNINAVKKGLNQALAPLKGSKVHGANQKKIATIIKSIKVDNIDAKIKEIDSVVSDIMKDNKEVNLKINNDISEINKKIKAFAQGQADRSKTIKEVATLVKGLTKGTRFGAVFGEMASTISKINDSNVDVKFDELLGLITDFYTLQQMSADKVTGLETAIKNLKEKVKEHKRQSRELADIKLKVAQNIKKATQQLRDLGVKEYRYSDVQKLVYKVNNATIGNIDKVLAQVSDTFDKVEDRGRKKKLRQIKAIVKSAAKTKKRSGRVVGKGSISADGQAFFAAAKNFLDMLKDYTTEQINEALNIREILSEYSTEDRADALANDDSIQPYLKIIKRLDKILGDNPLLASIPDILLGIDTMSLEELNSLELDLKSDKMAFAVELAEKKAIEKEARDQKIAQASEQIKDSYEMLYNKKTVDGETVLEPKTADELNRMKNPFFKIFKEEGARAAFKSMLDGFKLSNYAANFVGHLTSICSILDNLPEGKNFFTENIVNRLNRANSRFVKGLQDQRDKLDVLAQSINPKYTYDKIKNKIFKTVPLKIGNVTYSGDQLVRLYALLKNDVQREKLMKQNGFTLADIENINSSLDPDVKAFADIVVGYLSNDYYEQTNNVYRDVNNVNLPKIDNYFPTQTMSDRPSLKETAKVMAETVTGKLSAQGESFLKQRTNTKGPVAMMKGEGIPYTFTDVLDGLMEDTERFKAYAKDAKVLNSLLSSKEISNLLKMTGLRNLVNMLVSNAVQPVSSTNNFMNRNIKRLFSNFIGVKLGFKTWQIVKQASSSVMAFPEYENNLTKSLPQIVKTIPDLAMFLGDLATTLIDYRQYKEAYNTSPMFRERVQRFRKAGFSSLETTITEEQAKNRFLKYFKSIKKTGESFTFIGDILGVMGYWANYKRDIKNGMDPKLALEKFENYNKTQQTQRATEINAIQLASKEHPILMALTTFASTPFLMTSMVLESVNNINKQIKNTKGKKKLIAPLNALFNSKDGLRLMFALGVGNAMFAAVSNAMKYIFGVREDEEDFEKEVKRAALGYNTFTSLPFMGVAIEYAVAFSEGENMYGQQDMINPVADVFKQIFNSLKKEKTPFLKLFHDPKEKDPFMNVLFKYATGINTDPMIGVYQYIQGEKGAGYKALGITKSYLPKKQKSILEGGKVIDLEIFEE